MPLHTTLTYKCSVYLNLSYWLETHFIFLATVTLTLLIVNPVTRQYSNQGSYIPSFSKIDKFKLLTGNWFSIFSSNDLDLAQKTTKHLCESFTLWSGSIIILQTQLCMVNELLHSWILSFHEKWDKCTGIQYIKAWNVLKCRKLYLTNFLEKKNHKL